MKKIRLVSKDGVIIKTTVKVLNMSATIKYMLEAGIADDGILPVEVDSDVLRLILKWCNHHKNDPVPKDEPDCGCEKNIKGGFDSRLCFFHVSHVKEVLDTSSDEEEQKTEIYKLNAKCNSQITKWDEKFLDVDQGS